MRPAFDYLGTMTSLAPDINGIIKNWGGPYNQVSDAQRNLSQGQRKIALMRIPDAESRNFRTLDGKPADIVAWPCDTWGNPYVLYQVSAMPDAKSANNPLGLRLVKRPGELANYFNAVVSYGPNGVPGGGFPGTPQETNPAYISTWLEPAMLYVKGDLVGTGAEFTLKIMNPNTVNLQARLRTDPAFNESLAKSIHANSDQVGTWVPPAGEIGIMDENSDDIFWRF